MQEKIEHAQRKFLYTAHKEIFNITEELVQSGNHEEAQVETNNFEDTEKRASEDGDANARGHVSEPFTNFDLHPNTISDELRKLPEKVEDSVSDDFKSPQQSDLSDVKAATLERSDTNLQVEENILDDATDQENERHEEEIVDDAADQEKWKQEEDILDDAAEQESERQEEDIVDDAVDQENERQEDILDNTAESERQEEDILDDAADQESERQYALDFADDE